MDLEEDSLQEHLLNVYDSSPICTEILYKLLLDALRSRDFRSFRNTVEYNLRKQPPVLNINYIHPNHSEETYLDIASRNGLIEFVEFLLRKGANPNRVNEAHNRAPIHFATEGGYVDTLTALLAEPTINPNLEAGQQTALHIAVRKKDLACADLLLERGASASIPNSKGLTALHLAAMKGQRDMAELILNKCRQCPDVDSYKDYNHQTTREVIQQKLPELLLPPKSENREANANDLKYYLIANDETNFLRSLELVKIEVLHSVVEDLLEMATQRDFHEVVVGILEKLKGNLFSVKKAAQVAVEQGNHAILQELLNVEPEVANDLILNVCLELGMPGKRGIDNTSDRLQCLRLILEQERVDVRCTDNKGNTPLHYAARAGCREAVTLLLERGSYIGHMNKFNIPPIADIPMCTLSHYFDDCLQTQKERTNEYTIEFNYRCLMPHDVLTEHDKNHRTTSEMEVFKYMTCNGTLKHLLKHPLLSSFLFLKWHKIRHILYVNFVFYVIFYFLLNAYILGKTYDSSANKNETQTVNNSSNDAALGSTLQIAWYQNNLLWAFTTVSLLLFISRETLQFISCPWRYLQNLGNWLEITLIVLTVAVLCGAGPQVSAIVILLSAWELVIMISQHPRMTTGIEMFRTVSFNFARFLFPYAFLILAFALAFYTLFKDGDDTSFPDPGRSLFKTVIMLTGEFDATDIPFVSHPVWSHIVFVLFVFLIAIVLFNLLNGLAVSDTAEILCKAELIGLISRIGLLSYIEDVAIGKPCKRFCCGNSYSLRWNPFRFLAKRILLFPHCLRGGKINIKRYDCLDVYNKDRNYEKYIRNESVNRDKRWATLKMDLNIIKKAIQIISKKNQLSDNERIMITLNKLEEKLAGMELSLNIVKLAVENNNVDNTMESVRKD
ncbi:transient receptor potential cation channel protein painless [Anoplolepis gracilipes]|uniref:transient receptor potential cation channel protein painless n=1 Tax=Anoplolepis gracilipes TaxID=354296 RepID=UPI003B9E8F28